MIVESGCEATFQIVGVVYNTINLTETIQTKIPYGRFTIACDTHSIVQKYAYIDVIVLPQTLLAVANQIALKGNVVATRGRILSVEGTKRNKYDLQTNYYFLVDEIKLLVRNKAAKLPTASELEEILKANAAFSKEKDEDIEEIITTTCKAHKSYAKKG